MEGSDPNPGRARCFLLFPSVSKAFKSGPMCVCAQTRGGRAAAPTLHPGGCACSRLLPEMDAGEGRDGGDNRGEIPACVGRALLPQAQGCHLCSQVGLEQGVSIGVLERKSISAAVLGHSTSSPPPSSLFCLREPPRATLILHSPGASCSPVSSPKGPANRLQLHHLVDRSG